MQTEANKKNNRSEAVEFIIDNSRPLKEVKFGEWDLFYRLGDNGTNFMLLDMKENGYHLFYPDDKSLIEDSIQFFKEKTFSNYLKLK